MVVATGNIDTLSALWRLVEVVLLRPWVEEISALGHPKLGRGSYH